MKQREWEIFVVGVLTGIALTGLALFLLFKFGGMF